MASKTQLKTREKGSGTVYRDGKRWYLKIRIAGKPKTQMLRNEDGTPCTTEKSAIAAADGYKAVLLATSKAELAIHIAEAKKIQKQSEMLLAVAWSEYLKQSNRPDSGPATLKKYGLIFNLFLEWINKNRPKIKRLAEIDQDTVEAYFGDLWESGISASSYNSYRQALNLIFKHLVKPAGLQENPFDDIPKKVAETASRREFTAEQVDAIFNGFETGFFYETEIEKLTAGRKRERSVERLQYRPMNAQEMRVLLNLCCWTGCRGQDGCLMQWRNVNMEAGQISYIPRKTARKTNHKAVTLPMHPALHAALLDALQWRDQNREKEDFILPAVAARYKSNPSGIQQDVMKIIRCATGLETTSAESVGRRKLAANAYSLHSFRHTFVSFCANAGVPLAIVAEIVGHGNPAMTRHYSHITTEAKRGAIEALPVLESSFPTKSIEAPSELKQRLLEAVSNADEKQLDKILKILGE